MIVQVTSLQNSDPSSGWSKAGLMFRNDSTAGSANVSIVATAGQGVSFQWRSTAGGSSSFTVDGGITAPVWLKLVRSGANFTGYYSSDGINWMQVGSQQVTLNGTVMAGLDVTAAQQLGAEHRHVHQFKPVQCASADFRRLSPALDQS